jgi:hypothetical protein
MFLTVMPLLSEVGHHQGLQVRGIQVRIFHGDAEKDPMSRDVVFLCTRTPGIARQVPEVGLDLAGQPVRGLVLDRRLSPPLVYGPALIDVPLVVVVAVRGLLLAPLGLWRTTPL